MEKYINDVPSMTTIKLQGSEEEFLKMYQIDPDLKKKAEDRPIYHVRSIYSIGNMLKSAKGVPLTHDSVDVTTKIDKVLGEEARQKMTTTIRVASAKGRETAKAIRDAGLGILKNFYQQMGEISVFVVNQPLDRAQKYIAQMAPAIYPELVWENEMKEDFKPWQQAHGNKEGKGREISKEAERKAREAGHAAAKKIHGSDYSKEEADKHIDKILAKYKSEHDPKDHGDIIAIVVHSFRHDPAHKDEAIEVRLAKYLGETS